MLGEKIYNNVSQCSEGMLFNYANSYNSNFTLLQHLKRLNAKYPQTRKKSWYVEALAAVRVVAAKVRKENGLYKIIPCHVQR